MATQYFINETTSDKADIPEITFKYRKAENEQHIDILKHGRIYFSHPDEFPDKKDSATPLGYSSLTEEETIDKYYQELKNANKDNRLCDDEALFMVARMSAGWGLMNEENIADANAKIRNLLGIYSTCTKPDNAFLWKNYSDCYNGFCIGFDGLVLATQVGSGGGQVVYDKEFGKDYSSEIIVRLETIYQKLNEFVDEDEYRVKKYFKEQLPQQDGKRIIDVPHSAFKVLVIGEKVSVPRQKELVKYARYLNPDIKIKLARNVYCNPILEDYKEPSE